MFKIGYIKQKTIILIQSLCFLMLGCIENINLEINEVSEQMVINGSITTNPGPYSIKVSRAVDFYSQLTSYSNTVQDAQVIISSDDGQVEELTHVGFGVYQSSPSGIRGEIGRSYSVIVITKTGDTYQSKREKIVATSQIDSIYYEYQEKETFLENNIPVLKKQAVVKVDYTDDTDQENFYLWTWNNTFKFDTRPDLFENPPGILAPLPCSLFGCTCCTCWLSSEEHNDLAIANDNLTNGNNVKGQIVTTIPITAREFQYKYYVKVSQKSLSQEAYNFWSQLKGQESSSTIFATPPSRITGNLININNPGEVVWGFFSASDISEKSFFINPINIPGVLIDIDTIRNDCRSIPNATTQQPLFWE